VNNKKKTKKRKIKAAQKANRESKKKLKLQSNAKGDLEANQNDQDEDRNDQEEKQDETKEEAEYEIEDEKPPSEKSINIRLFPTHEQRILLDEFINTTRWTFNQALYQIKENGIHRTKEALRKAVVDNNNFETKNQWVKRAPRHIRDEAVSDLIKAYNSNLAKRKNNPNFNFEIRYRSKKKMIQESFVIQGDNAYVLNGNNPRKIGQLRFFPTLFGYQPIRSAEPIPHQAINPITHKLNYDSRILRNKLGQYFMAIPLPLEIVNLPEPKTCNTCSRTYYSTGPWSQNLSNRL